MTKLFRIAIAVLAGFATSFALVVLVELFSAVVHPTPSDFDGSMEEMCVHVANYPHWVLAAVVPMWGLTAFLGTWIAGRIGNGFGAIVVAVLLVAAVVWNVAMLPYPIWFKLVQPLVIFVTVALGYQRSSRPKAVSGD